MVINIHFKDALWCWGYHLRLFFAWPIHKNPKSKSPGEVAIIESSEKPTTEMLQVFSLTGYLNNPRSIFIFSQIAASWTHKLRFDKGHPIMFGGLIVPCGGCHHSPKDILRGSALEYGAPGGGQRWAKNPWFQLTNGPFKASKPLLQMGPSPKGCDSFWVLDQKMTLQGTSRTSNLWNRKKAFSTVCWEGIC